MLVAEARELLPIERQILTLLGRGGGITTRYLASQVAPLMGHNRRTHSGAELLEDAKEKGWRIFRVRSLKGASPARALSFRVRTFLNALDESKQFDPEDDGPEAREAKADIAAARADLELMDAAVAIHNAVFDPLVLVVPGG
jgi:hypothetical protein